VMAPVAHATYLKAACSRAHERLKGPKTISSPASEGLMPDGRRW
jgi:hypothetical protein